MCKVLNLLQIEYYFFIIRINKETINKMIISIRKVINKSFFLIISGLPSLEVWQVPKQSVFPNTKYTTNLYLVQVNIFYFFC